MRSCVNNARGWMQETFADGSVREHETFTCRHCNGLVVVGFKCAPETAGGICGGCQSMICPRCTAKGTCDTVEEKIRRMEASYEARRSYG